MHREKRETPPVFCPIQLARKSTHAGRIEWPASHAFVVRSVTRMFVRTTGRPRDEIGRTAWELKSGTSNLDGVSRKKSCGLPVAASLRDAPPARGKHFCVALRAAKRLQMSAQRDHFAQHAQTVAQKANFAALSVVPRHWNFANPQIGPMREIKQLDVEREAFDPRRFKNRSAHLEAKRFKSALRVPKRQPGGEPHQ